ncbi:MAG: response regulator, partial [Ignavibacteria bacterium]
MMTGSETAQLENIEVRYKPKVLIVEDEKGLRLGAKRLLQGEGYNVTVAENGTEGVALGTSAEFDLAVIDLKMPDLDGIDVMKEIVKIFPNTICFIVTAYASYDTAIEAAKLGAYSYIPKPFNPPELLEQLRKGYERRTLLLEAEKWRKERKERLLEVTFEKTRLNTIINSITDGVLV